VRDAAGGVAVARFADVEAEFGVDRGPVPGLLQHVADVPLRHALLDPAGQHLRGGTGPTTDRVEGEWLVRGDQQHPYLFEPVLDHGAVVGTPGDPVDALTHHHIEPAIRPVGLGE
jgi:hypothetical protein